VAPSPRGTTFASTRWSAVLAAGSSRDDSVSRKALSWLCERYWEPLRRHVRSRGYAADEAEDLVQGFFARLLEKRDLSADPARGRFRAYLLGSLNHYLSNQRDRERALKRGGGRAHVPLERTTEPAYEAEPEREFARAWATALLERVMDRLAREHDDERGRKRFAALRVFLAGNADAGTYAVAGAEVGMSEGAVKVAVHRLRRRYRELLREEVAETVADPAAVDDELRELLAALR
jgi:RNA polymerase sigma-70 factor (ECF subfamily)